MHKYKSMSALLLYLLPDIIGLPIVAGLFAAGYRVARIVQDKMNTTKYVFYKLTFPHGLKVEQQLAWLKSVSSTFSSSSRLPQHMENIVFNLRYDKTGYTPRIGIPWVHRELIDHLYTSVSGIHAEEHTFENVPKWTFATEAGLTNSRRMMNVDDIESQANRIITAMRAETTDDDIVDVSLVVNSIGHVRTPNYFLQQLLGVKPDKNVEKDQLLKAQQDQHKFVLRIAAASNTLPHARKLVSNVKNAYKAMNNSNVQFKARNTNQAAIFDRINGAKSLPFLPSRASSLELAMFTAWPLGGHAHPGMTLGKTQFLPPNAIIARNGRKIGNSVYDAFKNRPVAISEEGATRHVYAVGPSGRGKSALLNNMAQQDIEAGHGVIIIDAKGDQFFPLLDAIPYSRLDDVAVMDFSNADYPAAFNILQEGVVDDIYSMFVHNSPDSVYLKDVLHHALHAFSYFPDLTVIDVLPFVNAKTPMEKAWRDGLVERMPKNSPYRQYWQSFFALSDKEQRERVKPLVNRLWELSSRRDVYNFLGQSKSTIIPKQILRDNKILLVYLPENLGTPTVSLIGSMLVGNIWSSVRELRGVKETPTFLYMDEVQKFLSLPIDLPDMLSLARSYKLGLVMAHQYVDQLPRELFSAITNASTQIAFKLDGPDANRMQNVMGKSVAPEDFMNLDAYEVIARVATPGGTSDPTVLKTYPPFKPHGYAEDVVRRSRARFSRPASEVDKEIARRRTAPTKTEEKRERTFGKRMKEGGDE